MSTDYHSVCGAVNITEDDEGHLLIWTNSIPDHDILKDYYYRDTYNGFCLTIAPQDFTLTIPKTPSKNSESGCVPSLAGIAINGVELWNSYNQESLATALPQYAAVLDVQQGVDAGKGYMAEPMDTCGGHPGPDGTPYHYHMLPPQGFTWENVCFANVTPGVPSGIMGVAVDGFPIYGPFDENGNELTPADLDECNGREYNGSYRYILTREFPYGPGCLWGDVSPDVQEYLCWKAGDYRSLMSLTDFTLYSDCVKDPYSPSNGTSGCMSFNNNPEMYVDFGKGTLLQFNEAYIATCGMPDHQFENVDTTAG
eukprot:TRINITY_DN4069_c0_g1_i2.p1 TRINITY_DN4069_c0_g1~~TRINITY_DN4069_c0_g1_i2.p1  ORF type:complete len:359 (-),score=54.09 TRINITY_DN4069_c0_g1_i2:118-1050(-)